MGEGARLRVPPLEPGACPSVSDLPAPSPQDFALPSLLPSPSCLPASQVFPGLRSRTNAGVGRGWASLGWILVKPSPRLP